MPHLQKLEEGIGWKKLRASLIAVETVVNANTPLRGEGISINETAGGCMISLDKSTESAADRTGTGGTPTYSQITIQGVQWTDVTIIDPATCAQTTLTVLAQGAGSVTLNMTLS
jgi:hypothetical protein